MGVDAAPAAAPASAPAAAPAADAPAAAPASAPAADAKGGGASTPAAGAQAKDGFDSGGSGGGPASAGDVKGATLATPAGGGATSSGAVAAGIQTTVDRNFSAAIPAALPTVVPDLFTAAGASRADAQRAEAQKEAQVRTDAQKAADLIELVQHAATGSGREAALAALATLGANASGHAGADLGWINAELAKGLNVLASGNFSKTGSPETDRMLAVTGLVDGKYQIADPTNPGAKAMSAAELTSFIAAGAHGGFSISTNIPALNAKSGEGGAVEEEEAQSAEGETGTKAPVPTGGGTATGGTATGGTATGGTTAKDGTGTGGTTAKDGTVTGDTTAKDGTVTGGTTAKDGTGTGGTTAKDGTVTGGTTAKGGTDKTAKDGTTAKGAPAAKDPAAKEEKGNIFDETFSSKPHPATENKWRAAEEAANAPAAGWGGDAGLAPDRGFIARAPPLQWVGQEHPVGENANYRNGPENCGPAVLAMLARLRRLYPNLSDADLIMLLARLAGTTDHGTTGNGMIAALHEMGFQTEASKGADLNWIDQQLAQGHEVIANGDFYSVPGRENPKLQAGHYIAITANENGQYTINDPEDPNVHTMSAAQLKKFIASHPQGGFALAAW